MWKGVAMFARTSVWAGSPEAIDKWVENAETRVRAFVEGLPGNAGVYFFVDRQGGSALTLTLWDTADSAEATDRFAEQSRASTVEATGTELTSRASFEVVAEG